MQLAYMPTNNVLPHVLANSKEKKRTSRNTNEEQYSERQIKIRMRRRKGCGKEAGRRAALEKASSKSFSNAHFELLAYFLHVQIISFECTVFSQVLYNDQELGGFMADKGKNSLSSAKRQS